MKLFPNLPVKVVFWKKYLSSALNIFVQEPLPLGSLVWVTLGRAGWCHSLLPFIRYLASVFAMLTPSDTCLSKHFLKVLTDLNLKALTSPMCSGWNSVRCLAKAFLLLFLTMASLCSSNRCLAKYPDSPRYSVLTLKTKFRFFLSLTCHDSKLRQNLNELKYTDFPTQNGLIYYWYQCWDE